MWRCSGECATPPRPGGTRPPALGPVPDMRTLAQVSLRTQRTLQRMSEASSGWQGKPATNSWQRPERFTKSCGTHDLLKSCAWDLEFGFSDVSTKLLQILLHNVRVHSTMRPAMFQHTPSSVIALTRERWNKVSPEAVFQNEQLTAPSRAGAADKQHPPLSKWARDPTFVPLASCIPTPFSH